jgi:hypothetical protein
MAYTPDSSFIPLSPAAVPAPSSQPANPRVTVVSPAGQDLSFRPLGQATPVSRQPPAPVPEPRIELQREGDRVSSIRVHCGCGQVIELACAYDPPAAVPASPPPPPALPSSDAPVGKPEAAAATPPAAAARSKSVKR